jgi:tetratricopeptide (TPR) repeat protein
MEGIVAHAPAPDEVKKRFSQEFTEVFPRRLLISRENDVFAFEFTAEWMDLVARYVIGIASLLSRDVGYSRSLFEDLQEKVGRTRSNHPAFLKIRNRLPSRLADVYLTQAIASYGDWQQTRSLEDLDSMKDNLDKLKGVSADNYEGRLLRSIWHFLRHRDVVEAKREILRCKDTGDATWRFNHAFLLAYEGDMRQAVRIYRIAFRGIYPDQVPFQVEQFICWVLEEEPDKVQLHFCLGLINLFAKGDRERALRDLELFLERAPEDRFHEERERAIEYIHDIQDSPENLDI